MAKLERELNYDFDELLHRIERYSAMGGNRVSLNITLFQNGNGPVKLSAITSGGSQAMLFKINTFGESAFLDRLREILD